MKIGGVLMVILGALISLFAFVYETSVPTSLFEENASRTLNIGLMQNQQNILFVGLTLFLSGIIFLSAGEFISEVKKLKENLSGKS